MAALLQERSRLGANKHRALVLANEYVALLLFSLPKLFPLALQIELLQTLGSIRWHMTTCSLPECGVIDRDKLRNGALQFIW